MRNLLLTHKCVKSRANQAWRTGKHPNRHGTMKTSRTAVWETGDMTSWSGQGRHLAQVCRSSKEKSCTWQDDRAETPGTDLRGKSKEIRRNLAKSSIQPWAKTSRKKSGETKLACDLQSCGDKMGSTFKEDRLYMRLWGTLRLKVEVALYLPCV